jgi:cytochrome P450
MARTPACPFSPPPAELALQAEAPIAKVRLWDGGPAWLVTRQADQRALLGDPRISRDGERPGFPHASAAARERGTVGRTFIGMDDPEHARLRRMVTGRFAIKRVEALRPAIQRIVDDRIDRMLAGPRPVDPSAGLRAAGAVAGDLRSPRRAVCRPRLLPGEQQDSRQS